MDADAVRAEYTAMLLRARIRAKRERPDHLDTLIKKLGVAKSSVYAYLNGTTIPDAVSFDLVLRTLGCEPGEQRALSTLRDELALHHQLNRRNRGAVPVPRQLPASSDRFSGRDTELAILERVRTAEGVRIAVVEGGGGIGKSTLALRWARDVAKHFPGGQLYLDLRGHGNQPPMEPDAALHGFLLALGRLPAAIPADVSARAAMYRSLLAARGVLVILDNAGSAEQVRPLLPGDPSCMAVVTGRDGLDGLLVREGARRLVLNVLPPEARYDLLVRHLGAERVEAEHEAAVEIGELCAGLPLALSIVAARLDSRPARTLREQAKELRDDRLNAISSREPDLDLRTILNGSCTRLPPTATLLLTLAGACGLPALSVPLAGALLGEPDVSPEQAPEQALEDLARMHLMAQGPDGRYRAHDLVWEFAATRSPTLPEWERQAAKGRACGFYLATILRAAAVLEPTRAQDLPRAMDGMGTAPIPNALTWLEEEFPAIQVMIRLAHEAGFHEEAYRIAHAMNVFLRRTGRKRERIISQRIALSAAMADGDRLAVAVSRRLLGDALSRAGRFSEAEPLLTAALTDGAELGAGECVFDARLSLVRLHHLAGRDEPALEQALHALDSADSGGLPLADALAATAQQLQALDHPAEAISAATRALEIYRQLAYREGESQALRVRGKALSALGDPQAAIADLTSSLVLDEELSDRFWAMEALVDLAYAHEAAGDPFRAAALRAEAEAMSTWSA